jgi:hypothetical protein
MISIWNFLDTKVNMPFKGIKFLSICGM